MNCIYSAALKKISLFSLTILLVFLAVSYSFAMIVIDPGHGGYHPGATVTQGGKTYKEKDLNLQIALFLAEELKSRGYDIKMTRETDVYVSLEQRCEISNSLNADIFVSIHQNSFSSSSASGVEVYYYPGSVLGKALAEKLSASISAETGLKNRGAKKANFYVLRNTKAPAVLVECGFMSNPNELKLLSNPDFQRKIARAAASAIDDFVVEDLYSSLLERFDGKDRYETSAKISKALFSTADNAVIVSGEAHADAVVASSLAGYLKAPVLLSKSNYLPDVIQSELKRLNVKKAFIVGGSGVIADSVAAKLKSLGISVYRLAGRDRFETSVEVGKYLSSQYGLNRVFLVNGYNFADAIGVSNLSGAIGSPILFTGTNYCPKVVLQFIKELESNGVINAVIVVGGPSVVSDSVLRMFRNSKRIAGKDRYETSVLVQKEAISNFGLKPGKVGLANGINFSDALSLSPVGFKLMGVLLLTPSNSLHPKVQEFISQNAKSISKFLIAGGEKAVTVSCVRQIVITHLNHR